MCQLCGETTAARCQLPDIAPQYAARFAFDTAKTFRQFRVQLLWEEHGRFTAQHKNDMEETDDSVA